MFKKIRNMSSVRKATYLILLFSLCMFGATVYMTVDVDVLQDWELTLPDQKIHANDKITIASVYNKVMNVKGTSVRYLDCRNKQGIMIRYPLNQAVADRAPKAGGTGIVVVMPDTVPDLPAKCRVSVVIDYPVLPWRHVIETNETQEFILHPVRVSSASSSRDEQQKTNQTLAQAGPSSPAASVSSIVPLSASSSNTTPFNPTAQQDISQGEEVRQQTVELQHDPMPVTVCTVDIWGLCLLPR